MLRFFFDVLNDGEVPPDDGGLECDCRDAAEYGAARCAAEIGRVRSKSAGRKMAIRSSLRPFP
jgi:hypothetical protein